MIHSPCLIFRKAIEWFSWTFVPRIGTVYCATRVLYRCRTSFWPSACKTVGGTVVGRNAENHLMTAFVFITFDVPHEQWSLDRHFWCLFCLCLRVSVILPTWSVYPQQKRDYSALHPQAWTFIGRFSEAGLIEWMRFVIFRARCRERSQRTSGKISE